jgi:hypothetical protein
MESSITRGEQGQGGRVIPGAGFHWSGRVNLSKPFSLIGFALAGELHPLRYDEKTRSLRAGF